MRTALLAVILSMAATSLAQAQSPTPNLPSQGNSPSPMLSPTTPNAGHDEVAARRKLEDAGYKDLRSMTPNADGTFSARGTRPEPPGIRSEAAPRSMSRSTRRAISRNAKVPAPAQSMDKAT